VASFLSNIRREFGDDAIFPMLYPLSYTAGCPWQDSNLRPSKEPPHITTGELALHLIAGEWTMRYGISARRGPKSHGPEVTAIYHHRRMLYTRIPWLAAT